ncbi:MAG: AI-2E family transporter [Clostridium sp.]|nr:AI-2E family transporter [Clostridium sp.]
MPYSRKPYTFDRVVRIVVTIVSLIAVFLLVKALKSVLLPFCVACLIAYIFEPFVQYNRRLLRLKGRAAAVFVTLFESAFLLALVLYLIVPVLVGEVVSMAGILRHYAETETNIPYIPQQLHQFIKRNLDLSVISNYVSQDQIASLVENTLSTTWSIISGSISMVISMVSWLIVILYVVFIMLDYDRLALSLRAMVPPRYRMRVLRLGRDVEISMNHYFRGQALVAFIVGVLFSIGFSLIGLPMAIILGMFIGLLNLVPYLQLISFPITAFLCLVYTAAGSGDFWPIFWESMAVYVVVQAIQDLWLTPKIMGKAMGLNPAIILLSLSVWGSLLGFIGLIIALPLTTLILAYYERYISKQERAHGYSRRRIAADRRAIERATESPAPAPAPRPPKGGAKRQPPAAQ